jgi:hypothetical protein
MSTIELRDKCNENGISCFNENGGFKRRGTLIKDIEKKIQSGGLPDVLTEKEKAFVKLINSVLPNLLTDIEKATKQGKYDYTWTTGIPFGLFQEFTDAGFELSMAGISWNKAPKGTYAYKVTEIKSASALQEPVKSEEEGDPVIKIPGLLAGIEAAAKEGQYNYKWTTTTGIPIGMFGELTNAGFKPSWEGISWKEAPKGTYAYKFAAGEIAATKLKPVLKAASKPAGKHTMLELECPEQCLVTNINKIGKVAGMGYDPGCKKIYVDIDDCKGPWTIVKIIQDDPYAQVYKIQNKRGEQYILKIIPIIEDPEEEEMAVMEQKGEDGSPVSPMSAEMIDMEIEMQITASNAGLAPKIIEIIESDTTVSIIMESLEVSMREELSEHPEEKDNLSKIGVDLIRRLHGIGITHGDLHTGNFMRDANGKWMFIDFGRASKSTQNDLQNSLIQFGMSIT